MTINMTPIMNRRIFLRFFIAGGILSVLGRRFSSSGKKTDNMKQALFWRKV